MEIQIPKMPGILLSKYACWNKLWLAGQRHTSQLCSNAWTCKYPKTWETIETWNIGLDWSFFNNRLTGSFDWFTRFTYDMIGPAPELASVLGTGVPKVNNCDMKSYGFELEIGWRDKIGNFSYGIKTNLADDRQKF